MIPDEPRNRTVLQKTKTTNLTAAQSSGQVLQQEQVARSSGRQLETHLAAPEQCREINTTGSNLHRCRRLTVQWGEGEALRTAPLLSSQRDHGKTQSSQQTKSYWWLFGLVLKTFNQMQKRNQ